MSAPQPPNNIEAEQSVLGSLLLDRDAIAHVAPMLQPGDFYSSANGLVYAAITDLFHQRQPADLVTVTDALNRTGTLERIGGVAYLSSLFTIVPHAVHAGHYAEIVERTAAKRRLIDAGLALVKAGYCESTNLADDLTLARGKLSAVTRDRSRGSGKTFAEAVGEAALELEMRQDGEYEEDRMQTGFPDLDFLLGGGFDRGELIILGARAGMAKTSITLQFILNYARRCRVRQISPDWSIFYSSEMTIKALVRRAVAEATGIPWRNLTKGLDADGVTPLRDDVRRRVHIQIAEMQSLPIHVDDTSSPTTMTMRERTERFMIDHPVRFMAFDYLEQAGNPKDRNGSQEERVSQVAADLKSIAKTTDISVMALSQLNREVEKRGDKMPTIADLRQSGRIEQEADVVLLLYRQDYYTAQNNLDQRYIDPGKMGTCDVIIAKQRDGATGTVALQFIPELTAFRSMDRRSA